MARCTIDDGLFARAAQAAAQAGFSSVEEFIQSAIERELQRIGEETAEREVADQLRGLGYLE